jgi:hypothetical protein
MGYNEHMDLDQAKAMTEISNPRKDRAYRLGFQEGCNDPMGMLGPARRRAIELHIRTFPWHGEGHSEYDYYARGYREGSDGERARIQNKGGGHGI